MSDLYGTDFAQWSEQQAALLRGLAAARSSEPLDWDHLAEEIDSLGRAQRTQLLSLVRLILEHDLMLAHSPTDAPRRGWSETVRRARTDLDDLLATSPSLRREIAAAIQRQWPRAVGDVADTLEEYGETESAAAVRRADGPPDPASVLEASRE